MRYDRGGSIVTTESLTGRPFHLHPLSIPYRLLEQGIGLVVAAVFIGGSAFGAVAGTLGVTLAIGLAVVLAAGVVGYAVAYYRRFEYELTADTFDIRSGVFGRREREIPLHRIQNVDISQNVVQRALGIAEIRLETAGASGAEAQLKFVGVDRANQLQGEISRLRRAGDDGDEAADAEFETVFEISDRELGLLALTSADAQLIPLLFLGVSVFMPTLGSVFGVEWLSFVPGPGLGRVFGALLSVVGILLFAVVYGAINAATYYGFTLRRAPEEMRYERGLLQQYSGTIPLSKVQSLTIRENVLARALGYASLDIETAGQSGGEGNSGGSQSAVPLAERSRVLELTNSVEAVGDLSFERPPKRARERYAVRYAIVVAVVVALLYLIQRVAGITLYWWVPLFVLLLVPLAAHLKWKSRGYHLGEDHVVTRNGFWVQELKIVPYYRVQTVLSTETVFQRRRHLGTVTVDTAGARSLTNDDARAVDVADDTTEQLREAVGERLYASLRRRRAGADHRDAGDTSSENGEPS